MRKVVLGLMVLNFISCTQANTQNDRKWLVNVYLSNAYIHNLDVNAPVDLSKIDNSGEWILLTGESFEVDLSREVVRIKLLDLAHLNLNNKGVLGTPLGVNNNVDLEVKLFSWHTVYVTEDANGKRYENLYGLVSHDSGNTYKYEVIVPRREMK